MGYRSGVLQGTPGSYNDTGVIVGFKNPDDPSENGKQFSELMGKCIPLHARKLRWDGQNNIIPELASVDFDLFIGPRE